MLCWVFAEFNQLTSPKRPLPISLFAANNSETVFAEPADDDDEDWEDSGKMMIKIISIHIGIGLDGPVLS